MSLTHSQWRESIAKRHAQAVAAGWHDKLCEFDTAGFFLCHCSKRRREAEGFTEPPGDLEFPPPACPRCGDDVEHDGDSWRCCTCSVSWSSDGTGARFDDEHGDDLAEARAHWWREVQARDQQT